MPKFIDYHEKLPPMPPEVVEQMKATIQAGQTDEFGVKPINVYMGTGGQAVCMSEAPNAEAVRKAHEAKGIPVDSDTIIEVTSLV